MDKKITYLEIKGALCYFVPLIILNVFLLNYKEFSIIEVSTLSFILIWSARISRIFCAPILHLFKLHYLITGVSLLGALGYF